jgi:hypothetical protein
LNATIMRLILAAPGPVMLLVDVARLRRVDANARLLPMICWPAAAVGTRLEIDFAAIMPAGALFYWRAPLPYDQSSNGEEALGRSKLTAAGDDGGLLALETQLDDLVAQLICCSEGKRRANCEFGSAPSCAGQCGRWH